MKISIMMETSRITDRTIIIKENFNSKKSYIIALPEFRE